MLKVKDAPMSSEQNEQSSNYSLPENFSGIVRLFPLPNLVLFPGIVQSLHIFEPRYRKMMEDALAGDQTIAMTMINNSNSKTGRRPQIHSVICIGKIIAHTQLEDGRFNLLLQGVARARIVRELAVEQPYRMAEVEIIRDAEAVDESPSPESILKLRREIAACCKEFQTTAPELADELPTDLPLELLIDLVCYLLPHLTSEQRQELLEATGVIRRGQLLLKLAYAASKPSGKVDFPPPFSSN